MTKFATVVYAINDDNAFDSTQEMIEKKMAEFDENPNLPLGVCAISNTDEIHRLELIEHTLSSEVDAVSALDKIRNILALTKLPESTEAMEDEL